MFRNNRPPNVTLSLHVNARTVIVLKLERLHKNLILSVLHAGTARHWALASDAQCEVKKKKKSVFKKLPRTTVIHPKRPLSLFHKQRYVTHALEL